MNARQLRRLALAALCSTLLPAQAAESQPDPGAIALRGMFLLANVPLNQHPTCAQAGSQPGDRSIGDYLAGFMSAMREDQNRIEAGCTPHASGNARQRCTIWLKHRDADDEWAWGLQYDLDKHQRPLRASVRCLGSG